MTDIDLKKARTSNVSEKALKEYTEEIVKDKDAGAFAQGFLNLTADSKNTQFLSTVLNNPVADLGINYDIYLEKLKAKVGEQGGITAYRTRRYEDKETILSDAEKLYKEKVVEYMGYNFGPSKSKELAEKAMKSYIANELALLDAKYPEAILSTGIKEVVSEAMKQIDK